LTGPEGYDDPALTGAAITGTSIHIFNKKKVCNSWIVICHEHHHRMSLWTLHRTRTVEKRLMKCDKLSDSDGEPVPATCDVTAKLHELAVNFCVTQPAANSKQT
jgi:hypothetical protein